MKRCLVLIVCLALFTSFLAACSNEKQPSQEAAKTDAKEIGQNAPAQSGRFIYAIGGDTGNTLNPVTANDRWGLMTCHLLYSPPYRILPNGEVEYILAESMTLSEDGKSYTMILKPDLKWSDGQNLTADDVVFTFDAINANSSNLQINGQPIKTEKKDDRTIIFHLPEISASAFELLSAEISIIPKHFFESRDKYEINLLQDEVISSGPYTLAEYKTGQYLKFKANPLYSNGQAKIDEIILRVVEKADTANLALQNGEIDAWIASPDVLDNYENNEAFRVINYGEGRVAYLKLNPNTEAMKDKDYRRGILFALNRGEIMKAAYSDEKFYKLNPSFLPYDNPFYTEDVETYEQNLELAQELCANGPKNLKLAYISEDEFQEREALTIQAQLKKIGVAVELVGLKQAAFIPVAFDNKQKDYDIIMGGYVMGYDPDTFSPLFQSTKENWTNMSNPEIDRLFVEANATNEKEKRMELYHQLQRLVSEEAIFYPLGSNFRSLVVTSRLAGIEEAGLVPIYTFGDWSQLEMK